jgi:hypothetical protein
LPSRARGVSQKPDPRGEKAQQFVYLSQSFDDNPRRPTSPRDFARELVAAHLLACPTDASLSVKLTDDVPTLYAAVASTFPEIERMSLTATMWDEVVASVIDRGSPTAET